MGRKGEQMEALCLFCVNKKWFASKAQQENNDCLSFVLAVLTLGSNWAHKQQKNTRTKKQLGRSMPQTNLFFLLCT